MSRAAELYVQQYTHPQVRGGARALFEAIAHLVPEGHTTTPAIGMQALAVLARIDRRTVVRRLDALVQIGEVRVIDGGQGRVARYELVHLEGSHPTAATPLPLVGATPSRKLTRPLPPPSATPTLFDPAASGDQPAQPITITPFNLRQFVTSWPRNLCQTITSWCVLVIVSSRNLWQSITSTAQLATNDHKLAPPLDVDDARARDVHTSKEVHTHAAAALDAGPPPTDVHPWHAWCGGRAHVPKALHAEFLTKLGRLPGESDVDQEKRLFAFYAEVCAAIPAAQSIGNDFNFWRRAFSSQFVSAAPQPSRRPDGVVSNSGNCPHVPKCTTIPSCNERVLAEAREERAKAASG